LAKSSRKSAKKPLRRRVRSRRPAYVLPDCKRFTGYKPCFPGTKCYRKCVDPSPIGKKILIINLDAMGNVLATTTILPALKRKYPESTIFWITLKNAVGLLEENPYLDCVFPWEPESWLILQEMEFDLVLNADKSQRSCAFLNTLRSPEKLGYALNRNGVIVPSNPEAEANYILGLDDELKFHANARTVPELLREQFRLDGKRDEYVLSLSDRERRFSEEYRKETGLPGSTEEGRELLVGLNTGCSELYPNKKMTIEQHLELIDRLSAIPGIRLILLGGPEDTLRNAEIVRCRGEKVLSTPTTEGVRRGICYINLCDVVISGDSFGMHAAIALRKHVIVWFGVSCAQEIELYSRGIKLTPENLHCSPCWKRSCPYNLECIRMIDLDAIVAEVLRVKERRAPL
jgi:ADP-heptose:LPS heptosyltransferase